jgi:hypothetical protein
MLFVEFALNSGVSLTKGNKSDFPPSDVKWKMLNQFEFLSLRNWENLRTIRYQKYDLNIFDRRLD